MIAFHGVDGKGACWQPFPYPHLFRPYGTKLYVMTPETFTGWPERSVGLKWAPRAAATAAGLSSGCPLTALAEMTLPVSLINTWTVTAPDARTARAAAG